MAKPSSTSSRAQNDFGADLWVRQETNPHRHPTAGRGLFAGLQDVKHYNVESGWAKRTNEAPGAIGTFFSRLFGGSYRSPE